MLSTARRGSGGAWETVLVLALAFQAEFNFPLAQNTLFVRETLLPCVVEPQSSLGKVSVEGQRLSAAWEPVSLGGPRAWIACGSSLFRLPCWFVLTGFTERATLISRCLGAPHWAAGAEP